MNKEFIYFYKSARQVFLLLLQVQLYQESDKQNQSLQVNYDNTAVTNNSIKFHYTQDEYDKAIRAYIDFVLSKFF